MVVVTDASGLVMYRVGDERLKERAAEMNLVEGARYSEAADGTNGIGTALAADHAFRCSPSSTSTNAEPGKTGWLYMLDRATGKPLFDIPEKTVPQNALEHTSPTQPFPSNPPFISHTVSKVQLAAIHAAAAATSPAGEVPKIVTSPIFTQPAKHGSLSIYAVASGRAGRDRLADRRATTRGRS